MTKKKTKKKLKKKLNLKGKECIMGKFWQYDPPWDTDEEDDDEDPYADPKPL